MKTCKFRHYCFPRCTDWRVSTLISRPASVFCYGPVQWTEWVNVSTFFNLPLNLAAELTNGFHITFNVKVWWIGSQLWLRLLARKNLRQRPKLFPEGICIVLLLWFYYPDDKSSRSNLTSDFNFWLHLANWIGNLYCSVSQFCKDAAFTTQIHCCHML